MATKATKTAAKPVSAFKSKIAQELQPFARPVTDCQPHPDNARVHNLPLIARSLNSHGQRAAIVVQQSTGYIVKGNGTWAAATQVLGWTEIAQLWQELDDEQALAFLLADNKASDQSAYDPDRLVSALEKLVEGPGLMDSLWDTTELEDLVEAKVGVTVLEGVEPDAEFADAAYIGDREAKASAPGAKHKEVPLVMSVEEHAEFAQHVATLRKQLGTTGHVQTVVEAVRRMAEAEDGAVRVGRSATAEERHRIRRELVVELRDTVLSDPRFEKPTRPMILGMLESAEPHIPTVSPRREEAEQDTVEEPEQGLLGGDPALVPSEQDDPDDGDLAAYRTFQELIKEG